MVAQLWQMFTQSKYENMKTYYKQEVICATECVIFILL